MSVSVRHALLLMVISLVPAAALAQAPKASHWGVGASATPTWKSQEGFKKQLFIDEEGNLEGSEFTIGFVRGSTRGGDWGVSFVQKPIKNSTFGSTESNCPATPFCSTSSFTRQFQDVLLQGAEFHWFGAFATIKDRLQIGLNVAGGAAFAKGNILHVMDNVSRITNPNGTVTSFANHDEFLGPATDTLYSIYPLIKVEVQGAVIVTPAFKIKVSGGLNFPAVTMRIGAVYLIGAK